MHGGSYPTSVLFRKLRGRWENPKALPHKWITWNIYNCYGIKSARNSFLGYLIGVAIHHPVHWPLLQAQYSTDS